MGDEGAFVISTATAVSRQERDEVEQNQDKQLRERENK